MILPDPNKVVGTLDFHDKETRDAAVEAAVIHYWEELHADTGE